MDDSIEEFIRNIQEAETALIEEYIEKSIQGGKHGVKIVRKDWQIVEISVSDEVPYGHIYEHHHPSWRSS